MSSVSSIKFIEVKRNQIQSRRSTQSSAYVNEFVNKQTIHRSWNRGQGKRRGKTETAESHSVGFSCGDLKRREGKGRRFPLSSFPSCLLQAFVVSFLNILFLRIRQDKSCMVYHQVTIWTYRPPGMRCSRTKKK